VKILIVDPDATRASALKVALAAAGADVTVASSGAFALTMLEWNRHDIVVGRARIDDMDGHELCAILKSDPSTRHIRFALVAGANEVTPVQTTVAGVDLVLGPTLAISALVPLVLRLHQGGAAPAPPPAPAAPRTPAMPATPPAAPRVAAPATMRTATPAASRPAAARPLAPAAAPSRMPPAEPPPLRPQSPPHIEPPPPLHREPPAHAETPPVPKLRPAAAPPPAAEPPKRYVTAAAAAAAAPWAKTPPTILTPAPVARAVPAQSAAPASPSAEMMSMPSGTFQGSLDVMDLAELTQAIAMGGKNGRLILALPQGGGVIAFESGHVVHAEYRGMVGEQAFAALVTTAQADAAGRFCFLPSSGGEKSAQSRTIDKSVDRLLLSIATAIDEKG